MKQEISEELRKQLREKAHYDAIGHFICDGSDGELPREEAYDYMSELGGETPDSDKVNVWGPCEGMWSNVIIGYIDSEEEVLFNRYMEVAEMVLCTDAPTDVPDWDVEIECRVRKTIRVPAEDSDKAEETANELFSSLNDGMEERYNQDVVSCRKVEE